jgi:hypothetical protein
MAGNSFCDRLNRSPIAQMPFTFTSPPRSRRLRTQWLVLVTVSSMTTVLSVHAINAMLFYQMTATRLTLIGQTAVREGAELLVDDPASAIHLAQYCALSQGVVQSEISFIRTADHGRSLGISLKRKIPLFIAMLSPIVSKRMVCVTVWARARSKPSTQLPYGSAPLLIAIGPSVQSPR